LGLETNMEAEDIAAEVGIKREAVEYVAELVKRSAHMRSSPLTPD